MVNSNGLTRREMLAAAGMLSAGALLAGCSSGGQAASASTDTAASSASASASAPSSEQSSTGKVSLEVYDPTGSFEITQVFTERLDSLDGKTIAFLSDDSWEDRRMFADVRPLFEEMFTDIKFVTEDEFIHGIGEITKANNGVAEVMLEKGVDGAIIGNAG